MFAVLALIVGACGTGTRPPSQARAAAGVVTDGGVADSDEADAEDVAADVADSDSEGDVEASSEPAGEPSGPCPRNMVLVENEGARFCIDKYEASLVEVDGDGNEKPYPHWRTVDGRTVRAVSEPDVFPQAFISEVQAEDACAASGKRLCSHAEWKTACMGPEKTTFPYGSARRAGVCHDAGKSAVAAVFGLKALADPVAVAPPSKAPRVAGAKGATASSTKGGTASSTKGGTASSTKGGTASSAKGGTASSAKGATASRGSAAKPSAGKPAAGGSKATKQGRQAHVTTKGRAATTTKPRATRPGAVAAKPGKRRGDKGDKGGRTAARTTTKRGPTAARASSRPSSVEPSVWTQLNDPRLGQVEGALAKTGSHEECVNAYGALDMVGNLHEWVKTDPSLSHGTFAGGYFLDTTLNGDGCQYRTTAHAHDYHDYSTGFRCCADVAAVEGATPTASPQE